MSETGILHLEFWTVLTSLRDWSKALDVIDPYRLHDDEVEADAEIGAITRFGITEEEARGMLESMREIKGFRSARWFRHYDDYYNDIPTWEVGM